MSQRSIRLRVFQHESASRYQTEQSRMIPASEFDSAFVQRFACSISYFANYRLFRSACRQRFELVTQVDEMSNLLCFDRDDRKRREMMFDSGWRKRASPSDRLGPVQRVWYILIGPLYVAGCDAGRD